MEEPDFAESRESWQQYLGISIFGQQMLENLSCCWSLTSSL